MTLLSSGDRVGDTLVIDRPIGEGAFAEVHRVRHAFLGLQALKLFKRVASLEETTAMLGEARLLSTLGHPHIVRLFDANVVRTSDGLRGYFTMEYVAGGSLERLVRAHRPCVPTDMAVEIIEQIADGLAIAHDQSPPILHRDLTLANVLVGYERADLRVRISDFGLAKRADPFTMLASAQGTYAFMAPEVLLRQGYSCASDVWSVGTIAYVLLTNHFPYEDRDAFASFSAARFHRPLLPPSRFNDDVGADLDDVVVAALAVDPDDRPRTARALADALRARRAPGPRADGGALARQALGLAREPGGLAAAIDRMGQAIAADPALRPRYEPKLALWERGVIM